MLKLLVATLAVTTSTLIFGAAGATVYLVSGGIATVEVETPEIDLYLPVPTRLVDLGLEVAAVLTPAELRQWNDATARELRGHGRHAPPDLAELEPLVGALVDQIGRLPDGDLVRVRSGGDDVRVAQRDGVLHVAVDTPDAHVEVKLPVRSARRITRRTLYLFAPGF